MYIATATLSLANLYWDPLPTVANARVWYSVGVSTDQEYEVVTILRAGAYYFSDACGQNWNYETESWDYYSAITSFSAVSGPVEFAAMATGSATIFRTVTIIDPPVVLRQTASRTLNVGASVTFEALFGGGAPMFYQWRKDGVNINGATTAVLTLTNLQATSAGTYGLIATNTDGTASTTANLSINSVAGPTIQSHPVSRTIVLPVPAPSGGATLAAGGAHSLFVKHDGSVWTMGNNLCGQLGDGSAVDRVIPGPVPGLANVVSVAAGGWHSAALKSDGTVWVWGNPAFGYLILTPTQLSGQSGITAIAACGNYTLLLKNDGTVWICSGSTPLQLQNLSGIVSIAAGGGHSIAAKSDGTIWTWGSNHCGQLGDGTTISQMTPVQVWDDGGNHASSVAASQFASFALLADGTVRAWGYNSWGQLGDGTVVWRPAPVVVASLTGAASLGTSASSNHAFALKNDGTVWGWGWNGPEGRLGDGSTGSYQSTPIQTLFSGAAAVSAGGLHSLGLKTDGTLWVWGGNAAGQLGDGSLIDRSSPRQLAGVVGKLPNTSVAFAVQVTGSPEPAFQWQRKASGQSTFVNVDNGAVYAGATAATLVVRNLAGGMTGDEFRCVVANSQGTVTSSTAVLTVRVAPSVITAPQSASLTLGSQVTLSVVAAGTELGYQWKKNGIVIAGASTPLLAITNAQATDAGDYSVTIANSLSSVVAAAAVTFDAVPTVPTALNYVERTATTMTLMWRPATDDNGVGWYNVYRYGALIGTTYDVVFADSGLSANTPYLYTVKAVDTAGQLSPASNELSVTTTQDFSADGDSDGIPNAMETALGTNVSSRATAATSSQTQQIVHRPIQ